MMTIKNNRAGKASNQRGLFSGRLAAIGLECCPAADHVASFKRLELAEKADDFGNLVVVVTRTVLG